MYVALFISQAFIAMNLSYGNIFLPYKTLTIIDVNFTTFKTLINLR